MAWREVKVEEQRIQFINAYLEGIFTKAELFRRFDISPPVGYKWIKRFQEEGFEGLKDKSRAPLTQALATDPMLVEQILKVRFERSSWGPKKVLAHLKKHFPDLPWPSSTTIGHIYDRAGLTVGRKYRKRIAAKTVPLFNCQLNNDIWCTDFKGWFLTGDGKKCEPFTLTDSCSRYLLRCLNLSTHNTEHVWAVFESAFREYGLPLYVRSDNGPPFGTSGVGRLSSLSVKLIKAGVTPEWIDPGKPQQNGSHERMHLTLKQEAATPPEATLELQQSKLKDFQHYYNEIRPHEGIGQQTPGSIYLPSNRVWNGRLMSPEYPNEYHVRKVRDWGMMSWKNHNLFIGRALIGEPLGLKENLDGTLSVYYGPIILGVINKNIEFVYHENKTRRKTKKIDNKTIKE